MNCIKLVVDLESDGEIRFNYANPYRNCMVSIYKDVIDRAWVRTRVFEKRMFKRFGDQV